MKPLQRCRQSAAYNRDAIWSTCHWQRGFEGEVALHLMTRVAPFVLTLETQYEMLSDAKRLCSFKSVASRSLAGLRKATPALRDGSLTGCICIVGAKGNQREWGATACEAG